MTLLQLISAFGGGILLGLYIGLTLAGIVLRRAEAADRPVKFGDTRYYLVEQNRMHALNVAKLRCDRQDETRRAVNDWEAA